MSITAHYWIARQDIGRNDLTDFVRRYGGWRPPAAQLASGRGETKEL